MYIRDKVYKDLVVVTGIVVSKNFVFLLQQ